MPMATTPTKRLPRPKRLKAFIAPGSYLIGLCPVKPEYDFSIRNFDC
jgi:hypothetical protein